MNNRGAAILNEMRYIARKRGFVPPRPEPADCWEAVGGNGPSALLTMLEYERARQIVQAELAREAA